ncbi:MAG: fused MFS/spermidine synthase [Tepidisphaeraceae bacterium]
MSEIRSTESATADSAPAYLPLLLLLFIGSGCAALIYEIVWFQLLQLVIGSSAVSIGALLGTFMGGMCLGSLVLPRLIPARLHPLRVYAVLELCIGIIGLIVLFAIPGIGGLYVANAVGGWEGIVLRGIVSSICLLPPTLLMGATLPAISRWIETTPRGVAWLGFFYGGNTVGAVLGCVLAGFYLLRIYDMAVATYVAVSINVAVAVVALVTSLFARRTRATVTPTRLIEPLKDAAPPSIPHEKRVLAAMMLGRENAEKIVKIIDRSAFIDRNHQVVFDVLVELFEERRPTSVVMVREELIKRGSLEKIGGAEYLAEILNSTPYGSDGSDAVQLAETLRGKIKARQTISAAREEKGGAKGARGRGIIPVYFVIALSGMSALGAEVVWTRLLSLLLGATVYTFSIILAVFLIGLGIGSSLGAAMSRGFEKEQRNSHNARMLLGGCQFLLAGAITWTALALAKSLPYWPIDPSLASTPGFMFQIDLLRCAWAILPATILWGASFPLALAAAAERGGDPARLVGAVYAANTLGAIIGALVFSLILIPWIGTMNAQRVMIGLCAVAAMVALIERRSWLRLPWVAVALACCGWLGWHVYPTPWKLVAYGRYISSYMKDDPSVDAVPLYVGEGINSTVAVTEETDGVRNFHVAGKIEASTEPQDMRLQRMLGDLPGLVHPHPHSVLIVGCGAGVTAGSFIVQPDIKRIVICEIEPLIPENVSDQFFAKENYGVVKDPRVQIVYDDARHFVLTTKEKFDIITSDPIHPWVKGAATLYTKEYFQICKDHLNPGGVVSQWVPLYQSTEPVVKSEFATFFKVFPSGTIWSNTVDNAGYDVVLLGMENEHATINVDLMQARLGLPEYQEMAQSLTDVGFNSVTDLLGTYAAQASDLTGWLADAQINTDRDLRLQYLAGLGMDSKDGGRIYSGMTSNFNYPGDLFVASRAVKLQLDIAMLRARGRQ